MSDETPAAPPPGNQPGDQPGNQPENPPPPAYGTPPPPPPPAYGAPPAGGSGYQPVEAIKYGWAKFTGSPATLLVPTLIVAVALIAVEVVAFLVINATLLDTDCTVRSTDTGISFDGCDGPGFFTRIFAYALVSFLVSLISSCLGAGLVKCALNTVDGKPVNAGDVIGYALKPNVVTTAAILAVLTFIGTLLCYLPGIVVSFFTVFALFFVVDKDQGPAQAIRSSVDLVMKNLGDVLIFFLLGIVCLVVGAIACGIGILVAIPVVVAAAAYTFRRLQDEPVGPVA